MPTHQITVSLGKDGISFDGLLSIRTTHDVHTHLHDLIGNTGAEMPGVFYRVNRRDKVSFLVEQKNGRTPKSVADAIIAAIEDYAPDIDFVFAE